MRLPALCQRAAGGRHRVQACGACVWQLGPQRAVLCWAGMHGGCAVLCWGLPARAPHPLGIAGRTLRSAAGCGGTCGGTLQQGHGLGGRLRCGACCEADAHALAWGTAHKQPGGMQTARKAGMQPSNQPASQTAGCLPPNKPSVPARTLVSAAGLAYAGWDASCHQHLHQALWRQRQVGGGAEPAKRLPQHAPAAAGGAALGHNRAADELGVPHYAVSPAWRRGAREQAGRERRGKQSGQPARTPQFPPYRRLPASAAAARHPCNNCTTGTAKALPSAQAQPATQPPSQPSRPPSRT